MGAGSPTLVVCQSTRCDVACPPASDFRNAIRQQKKKECENDPSGSRRAWWPDLWRRQRPPTNPTEIVERLALPDASPSVGEDHDVSIQTPMRIQPSQYQCIS